MSFLSVIFNNYIVAWKRSFEFKGTTSRIDFWYFLGFDLLLLSVIATIGGRFGAILLFPYLVISMFPRLAIGIRRLRDAGKSLLWMFIILLPGIGTLILWVQLAQPTKRNNDQI